MGISWTPEQREIYKTIGGAPGLDMGYTVFGEVVDGLSVVDAIAQLSRDPSDRPYEDIRMKVSIIAPK
jgi:peptidyl-prolyl cis-trans isomerase B (cyclophilin B)